ncbi:unnamed protein product [Cuscuta europaea]|uniref:Uncharacterized protein n=1 Tax=Cuscuta europaea TaxID=41803 RepID=A0A9P0ZK70_CUSEU|nr:unnamed protein product [Cuscuta europaea]
MSEEKHHRHHFGHRKDDEEENRQPSYPDSTTGFGGDISNNDTYGAYEKPYDQVTATGYGRDESCNYEKQTTAGYEYGQESYGIGQEAADYEDNKPAGRSHEDLEKEKKHHKHLQQIGELGTAAAGAYALYEKHEAKKDPEHAHRHKIEEEVAAAAAVGSGGFAFHEHHEKKEAKEDEEAAEGHKKKYHFF